MTANLTDEQLMRALQNGNKQAFEVLYSRYNKRLYNFINRFINDSEKANDLLHDVFIKVIEAPDTFDANKKFSTWLYTLAANMCKNELRNTLKRRQILDTHKKDIPLSIHSTISKLDNSNLKKELDVFLESLDEDLKTIFLLRFHEDMSIADISDIIGCPAGTVKSRLFYLLKRLATELHVYNPLT